MPRKPSSRELALRERWPKWDWLLWDPCDEGQRFEAHAFLRNSPGQQAYTVVDGRLCTRRSDAWRSLERAMERTRKAVEPRLKQEPYPTGWGLISTDEEKP